MEEIDKKFKKAFKISSSIKKKLPPDTMLKLYAFYKQATQGKHYASPSGESSIRNAFKLNALLQVNNLSEKEAKQQYINLVEKITQQKIN